MEAKLLIAVRRRIISRRSAPSPGQECAPSARPQKLLASAPSEKSPEVRTSGLFWNIRSICVGQRLRLLAFRSREAACLCGALFFAEPFRAGAEARRTAFAAGLGLAAVRFSAARFSGLLAATLLAAFRGAVRVFAEFSTGALTFSGAFAGAALVGLTTSLLVFTATVCVVTTDAAGAAEAAFVLPFGRPPFLAN